MKHLLARPRCASPGDRRTLLGEADVLPVQSRGVSSRAGIVEARGFTLLEVLMVIGILAILTAIAVPSYQDSIRRGHRSEARATVLQAAQFMERVRTERNTYAPGGVAPTLPGSLAQLPVSGAARYTVTVSAVTATTYTISAQPAGVMAGDVCGNLSVDETGQRGYSGGSGTMLLCWER